MRLELCGYYVYPLNILIVLGIVLGGCAVAAKVWQSLRKPALGKMPADGLIRQSNAAGVVLVAPCAKKKSAHRQPAAQKRKTKALRQATEKPARSPSFEKEQPPAAAQTTSPAPNPKPPLAVTTAERHAEKVDSKPKTMPKVQARKKSVRRRSAFFARKTGWEIGGWERERVLALLEQASQSAGQTEYGRCMTSLGDLVRESDVWSLGDIRKIDEDALLYLNALLFGEIGRLMLKEPLQAAALLFVMDAVNGGLKDGHVAETGWMAKSIVPAENAGYLTEDDCRVVALLETSLERFVQAAVDPSTGLVDLCLPGLPLFMRDLRLDTLAEAQRQLQKIQDYGLFSADVRRCLLGVMHWRMDDLIKNGRCPMEGQDISFLRAFACLIGDDGYEELAKKLPLQK